MCTTATPTATPPQLFAPTRLYQHHLPQEKSSSIWYFGLFKFRARIVIGNFENSRWHLEAYAAIVSNDHIRPILGRITMPIVINVERLFLIRS